MSRPTSLQSVAAVTSDIICALDESWVVADVNPAFSDRLGWPLERAKGRLFTDFIFPDDRGSVRSGLSRLRGEVKFVEVRCRCHRADGSLVWVDWRATFHEFSVLIVGREMPAEDEGIAALVTMAVRKQIAEDERRRLAADEERANVNASLLQTQHRANVAQTRAKTLQTFIAAGIAVTTTLGAGAVWAINRVEESALKAKAAQDHRDRVDSDLAGVSKRIEDHEKKIHQLGRSVIEMQIQVSDGTAYLADKIDAANPRAAKKVEPPPTVTKARTRVDEIKRSTRENDFFSADIDDDPFVGATDGR